VNQRNEYILLLLLGLLFGFLIHQKTSSDYQKALAQFKQVSLETSNSIAQRLTNELRDVYQNLRTISLLPYIRTIDRHATNLEPNTRLAINTIYQNLR